MIRSGLLLAFGVLARATGLTVDPIPLKQMILPLVVFDMPLIIATDPNHAWSVDDLRAAENVHGAVPASSFAALRTDMSKDWTSNPERWFGNLRDHR